MRVELALLRARALLRIDHPDKAIDALRSFAYAPLGADEYVTAQMLLGAAYVRLGQTERGVDILEDVRARAVHPTVRAELLVNLGVARFQQSRFDEAQELFQGVDAAADIIRARALEYLGWIAIARNDFAEASVRFSAALQYLDHCRYRDRFVEANIVYGWASVALERLQADEWRGVEQRIKAFDWPPDEMVLPRFWTAVCASAVAEIMGDVTGAREYVRSAESFVRDDGHRVIALCRMADIFCALGEIHGQHEFLSRATSLYDALSVRELVGHLRQVPLVLAEAMLCAGMVPAATRLFRQYQEVLGPGAREDLNSPRYAAFEAAVEGGIAEGMGDAAQAVRSYTASFELFDRHGLRRRASMAALRLAKLTGKARYRDYVRSVVEAFPHYWMSTELQKLEPRGGVRLSPTQSGVLQLVAEGKTYKEIAAVRGGSWKTTRNVVHVLFRKFEVKNKGELVAVATRAGVI